MADLRLDIGTGIKSVDIYDSTGTKLDTKYINVGNKEVMKRWATQFSNIAEIKPDDGMTFLDDLEAMERMLIGETVGDFDLFWKASGENALVLLNILKQLSEFITKELEKLYKDFV